jgi:hypothetical protein
MSVKKFKKTRMRDFEVDMCIRFGDGRSTAKVSEPVRAHNQHQAEDVAHKRMYEKYGAASIVSTSVSEVKED